ncbi:MAG: hypothetical protein QW310_03040 [Thermoproteota archaeon]|nr:hypothetical protein [Candidatus Brockarchaeota archaeon]
MPEVSIPYSDTRVYLSFSLEEVGLIKESKLREILNKVNNSFLQLTSENTLLLDELLLLSMSKTQSPFFKQNFFVLSPYEKKRTFSIPELAQIQGSRLDTLDERIKEPQVIIFSTIFLFNDILRLFGKFAWNFDKSGFFSVLDAVIKEDFSSNSLANFVSFIGDFFEEVLQPNKVVLLGGESLIKEFTSLKDFKNWLSASNKVYFMTDDVNSLIFSLGGYPFDLLPSYYLIGINSLISLLKDKIVGILAFWNGIHEEITLLSNIGNFTLDSWDWLRLNLYFLSKTKKGNQSSRFFSSVPQVIMNKLLPCRTFFSSRLFLDSIRRGTGFKMRANIYKDVLFS